MLAVNSLQPSGFQKSLRGLARHPSAQDQTTVMQAGRSDPNSAPTYLNVTVLVEEVDVLLLIEVVSH